MKIKTDVVLIINCFDSEKFISDTISSLLNQKYKDLILLIVDNKSSDNTFKIINSYKKNNNNIFIIVLKKHLSLVDARLYALNYLRKNFDFKYFGFCDSDDLWSPDWIYKLMKHGKGYDLIYSNGYEFYIDRNGNKINKEVNSCLSNKKFDAFSSSIFLQSAIFSKNILSFLGNEILDTNLPMHYDIDLFLRLNQNRISYLHLSDRLFFYRLHYNSLSRQNQNQTLKERYYITKKHKFSKLRFILKLIIYKFKINKILKKLIM